MAELTIELSEDQERRLEELAAGEHRTMQQLANSAVETYIRSHPQNQELDVDAGWDALLSIVGIGGSGRDDGSVNHDSIYHDDR